PRRAAHAGEGPPCRRRNPYLPACRGWRPGSTEPRPGHWPPHPHPLGERPMIPIDVHGDGPPVVVLHGPPVPPESMGLIIERLAVQHRVLVPRLRGRSRDAVAATRQVAAALDALGVTRAAVVTHSFASTHAFRLALDSDIDVPRIAALGPVGHLDDETLAGFAALGDAIEAGTVDPTTTLLAGWF